MDGMIATVKAHYGGDAGSNVADRVRALLQTLGPGLASPERLAAPEQSYFTYGGSQFVVTSPRSAGILPARHMPRGWRRHEHPIICNHQ